MVGVDGGDLAFDLGAYAGDEVLGGFAKAFSEHVDDDVGDHGVGYGLPGGRWRDGGPVVIGVAFTCHGVSLGERGG